MSDESLKCEKLRRERDEWKRRALAAESKIAHLRSPKWPSVRQKHLKKEPLCQVCRQTERLEVHHIYPFHLRPELELDDTNLITLCESARECHLKIGHLGNWKKYNPDITKYRKERP